MSRAWQVFDSRGDGELNAEEFARVLPLLGEDVPPSRVDELFAIADKDGSGLLEYTEFQVMLIGLCDENAGGTAVEEADPLEADLEVVAAAVVEEGQ